MAGVLNGRLGAGLVDRRGASEAPGYKIISTRIKGFDYPKGNENVYASYEEKGGILLDIAQAQPVQAVFIDNTPMFVQIAEGLGIQGILHTDSKSTRTMLSHLGLNAE